MSAGAKGATPRLPRAADRPKSGDAERRTGALARHRIAVKASDYRGGLAGILTKRYVEPPYCAVVMPNNMIK